MRAWLIDETNKSLQLGEVETPRPGPTEIRVRVEAAGVNRADLLQVQGAYPPPFGTDPRIPGLEYAGVVDEVGDRVQLFAPGDRVMGLVPGAAYAEFVVTNEREAIRVPEGLDALQAAAVPEDFMTAYRALYLEGGLQPGEWALVRPCTSGVGLAAIQLIHAFGGRSVGTSRSAQRIEGAREQGMDVACLDGEGALPQRVRDATGGGVAVALEMLGGKALADSLSSLRTDGRLVLVGLLAGRSAELDLGAVLFRRLGLKAMTMRAQPPEERIRVARLFSDRVVPLFDSERLRPLVSLTFGFDDTPQAHAAMADNQHLGKIVIGF